MKKYGMMAGLFLLMGFGTAFGSGGCTAAAQDLVQAQERYYSAETANEFIIEVCNEARDQKFCYSVVREDYRMAKQEIRQARAEYQAACKN